MTTSSRQRWGGPYTCAMKTIRALALVALATPFALHAAEPPYPTRPVRILIGFPPGGGVDALARVLGPKLSDAMGQSWVIENRPGAAGNIAAEIAAHATPDGHTTLMALNTQLTVNPSLYKMNFSVEKELAPVMKIVRAEHIVVLHPSVPAKTLKELIALAKQKPRSLNYASAGVGSSLHMAAELLKKRTGMDMVHVAYKGAGPAVQAMLSGEAQVLCGTVVSTTALLSAGKLRAIASLGSRRSKVLPDIPTVAESGYPGFEADAWYGMLVPRGTPASVVTRIRNEILKAMQMQDVQTALGRLGLDGETTTSAELAALIKSESAMYASLIREAGIKAE